MNHKNHYIAATCWIALIPLTLLWDGIFAPLHTGNWLLFIKMLPLCLPLQGILSGRIYTYQYCSMLILLPFTEGVMRIWDAASYSAWFASVQILFSVIFFITCLTYLKQFKIQKAHKTPKNAA